jgi:calcineurin-like phosphoesterase family protein
MKHIILTILITVPFIIFISILLGKQFTYKSNPQRKKLNNDGPYVFFKNDTLIQLNYIKGDKIEGYYIESEELSLNETINIDCYYPLDSSKFKVKLSSNFRTPDCVYEDSEKILAISDIESNYKTFRDFLINNEVIDNNLNWTFGKGHLVLVGDFIDRGYFTTQVLWFIYKLEQDAGQYGGKVHFILGNHEIMNMQGDHRYASSKYNYVSSILNKKQFELYSKDSFLGKWMESKNTIEVINNVLFVHGGLHPDVTDIELKLEDINNLIRENYYKPYYPKKNRPEMERFLLSSKTSPYWYRGYFNNGITKSEELEQVFTKFNVKSIVVGHTVQSQIKRLLDKKIVAIDLKHPSDHEKHWPKRTSEGLLIQNGKCYRVFENGNKKELK